ncbi:MAG TPA: S8 family serine peptidase [Thermoanaerobaculia bacterium]|jgi:subtilisin family serine protease|nr:S8 family serine peptidase [Thermoanaerobaculia bacterium]
MPTFAQAVQQVDATGLPVVEGFAVKLRAGAAEAAGAAIAAELAVRFPPPYAWQADDRPGKWPEGWRMYRISGGSPPLGEAWEAVRALKAIPGVETAEPLLLTKPPVTNGSDAQAAFQLWGKVNDDRLAQITKASQPPHWSLAQLGVLDGGPEKPGAWSIWKTKRGDDPPGKGILVAHPDTGYTRHARLLPHLLPHPDNPNLFGRDFVDRTQPDGFDSMKDQSFASFPGHGTGTASVIATGNSPDGEPWGVAPGAKILPLRVSSSVIHLSFQNLCDAFVEAMDKKAHVISMSLGGPLGSELLNSLIRKALDQGIIVVSAAGNNAPTVVFPARIPGVLACAASNAVAAPWRFSGLGGEVAITAPGELVWHDWERLDSQGKPTDDRTNGSGTSFATANVAGLAALWLSYHGRDNLIQNYCSNRAELLPFLFRLCLQRSSDGKPDFLRGGKGGFGAGIAKADRLLNQARPSVPEVDAARTKILAGKPDGIVSFPLNSWWTILTLPTLTENGPVLAESAASNDTSLNDFFTALAPNLDVEDRAEIGTLAASDVLLSNALAKASQGGRNCISAAAVRRYLLRKGVPLSKFLRDKLTGAQTDAQKAWIGNHTELSLAKAYILPSAEEEEKKSAYSVAPPPTRRLRAFAFDPSLTTSSSEVAINEITIPVVFERKLEPGPVGDYLEVVDVDPASDCAYAPVDLNHPFLLAQDGLPRSEGNPQFHQQMVYAVAMKTISHFEEALGRPIFWSPLRPWDPFSDDKDRALVRHKKDKEGNVVKDDKGRPEIDKADQFVQHLRLHPHALREQNAYYSPQKRAILFGYFPAGDGDPGAEYPGGVVFVCLAHDIIAHETTHAIVDGMHVRYTEPTNPDVFAFHEAFADIVALFQRFTYSELLRDQIAQARGRLEAGTLMTRLALQFGQATGRRQALRDALGYVVKQARQRGDFDWRDRLEEREADGSSERRVTIADAARDLSDEETRSVWQRFQADPSLLKKVEEPHDRGSFLVAAVFDAYLRIYEARVADLKRIATGGTGVLPEGDLHPDLVNRMAQEASKSARHVLRMCIRAMDYMPPVDITFGEFLRALITADSDLVPKDDLRYRVAFIEAFRKWGIYPRDVRTLSEESLRWSPPRAEKTLLFPRDQKIPEEINLVRRALLEWQPGETREEIFKKINEAQAVLHGYFQDKKLDKETKRLILGGIDTSRSFQVTNLRPARRIGPRGEFLTEMVIEVLQNKNAMPTDPAEHKAEEKRRREARQERKRMGEVEEAEPLPFRGGATLIIGMERDEYIVRYAIYKRPDSASREARQHEFLRAGGAGSPDAAEYSSDGLPSGWYTRDDVRNEWLKNRVSDLEGMRASSCACRRGRMDGAEKKATEKAAKKAGAPVPTALTEPFALLHRG